MKFYFLWSWVEKTQEACAEDLSHQNEASKKTLAEEDCGKSTRPESWWILSLDGTWLSSSESWKFKQCLLNSIRRSLWAAPKLWSRCIQHNSSCIPHDYPPLNICIKQSGGSLSADTCNCIFWWKMPFADSWLFWFFLKKCLAPITIKECQAMLSSTAVFKPGFLRFSPDPSQCSLFFSLWNLACSYLFHWHHFWVRIGCLMWTLSQSGFCIFPVMMTQRVCGT